MKSSRKLIIAFLLAVVVNAGGLLLMSQINLLDESYKKVAKSEKSSIILQKKKKKRKKNKKRVKKKKNYKRHVPTPNMSPQKALSNLNLPGVGGIDLIGDMGGGNVGLGTDLILKEDAVDEPPRVIGRVAPRYPVSAERRGIEGYVVFKLQLSKEGTVEKVWLKDSSPQGVFEAVAEQAIRRYRFSPARYQGQPVAVICKQKIIFNLD